jgi:hypothetical protein
MSYPDQLLPKIEYRDEIAVGGLVATSGEYYLIRLSMVPVQDPRNIKMREMCPQTKDFVGMSANLLGVFELVHLPLKPNDRPRPDYWKKSDGSIKPDDIHFEVVEGRDPIFIRISDLHDRDIPATKMVDQNSIEVKFRIRIKHMPIKPNYWHFEARLLNPSNVQELDRDHLFDWIKNAIKKFLEIDICHKASGLQPATHTIISQRFFVEGTEL